MRRYLLDTGVVIGIERKILDPTKVFTADDDVALSVITATELLHGVARTDDTRRPIRAAWVEAILAAFSIEDVTMPVSRINASLKAHGQAQGLTRGAYDLLIAATAAATDRILITTDAKARFHELPGVTSQVIHS